MTKRQKATRGSTEKYRVFLSHATADKWLATVLCERIHSAGAATFRDDRDIEGGDDIPDRIRLAIQEADEVVLLLTPESVDRPWVLFEAGAAWGKREETRIVAVMCHVDADRIPGMIASKKAVPINDFDRYVVELQNRIGGMP